jgi:hypothetical protein
LSGVSPRRRADETYYACFVHKDEDAAPEAAAPVQPRPVRKTTRAVR